jgi:hypothetical protein
MTERTIIPYYKQEECFEESKKGINKLFGKHLLFVGEDLLNSKDDKKRYYLFKNKDEYKEWIDKQEKKNCYELIKEDKECKTYFDIEKAVLCNSIKSKEYIKEFSNILIHMNKLIEYLHNIIDDGCDESFTTTTLISLYEEPKMIYEKIRDKDGKKIEKEIGIGIKISFHIIINGLKVKNNRCIPSIISEFLKENKEDYIDNSVYSRNRLFRMLDNSKKNKNVYLEFLTLEILKKIINNDSININKNENILIEDIFNMIQDDKQIFENTLITIFNGNERLLKYEPFIKEMKNINKDNNIINDEEEENIFKRVNILLKKNIDNGKLSKDIENFILTNEIINNEGYLPFIPFQRHNGYECLICNKIHENIIPSIIINKEKNLIGFNCWRHNLYGGKILKLGNIINKKIVDKINEENKINEIIIDEQYDFCDLEYELGKKNINQDNFNDTVKKLKLSLLYDQSKSEYNKIMDKKMININKSELIDIKINIENKDNDGKINMDEINLFKFITGKEFGVLKSEITFKNIICYPKIGHRNDISLKEYKRSYNTFKGFAQPIIEKYDYNIVKEFNEKFLEKIMDKEGFFHFINWVRYMLQYPEKKIPALILYGNQGTGKSFLINFLMKLIVGIENSTVVKDKEFSNKFNSFLENYFLIVCHEFNLKKEEMNNLKSYISDIILSIENKNKNVKISENYSKFIFATNNFDDLDETIRKFLLIFINDTYLLNGEFFSSLEKEIIEKDIAINWFNWILKTPIDEKFDINKVHTKFVLELINEKRSHLDSFILNLFIDKAEKDKIKETDGTISLESIICAYNDCKDVEKEYKIPKEIKIVANKYLNKLENSKSKSKVFYNSIKAPYLKYYVE